MVPKKVLNKEDEQLNDYELVFIISPEVTEENLDTTIEGVSQFITGKGGIVSDVEKWGKRRLAYPIKHLGEGSYVLLKLKLKPVHNKELDANLNISEDILRHLLIKLN